MKPTHAQSSSTSESPPEALLEAPFRFLLFTLPGHPPPSELVGKKSMCFCQLTLTMKVGMLTTCLPTLQVGKYWVLENYWSGRKNSYR
ncbi:hypothetical protein QJS04_geneDACA024788 [Acorus gramineus]|uniref:Uncharacterized protein n=1 Tax=Acorus gramineus TaxID=55184 RepID=A0AAV9A0L4_ACOGR|nr:hypothetical protein QJS04_geneDACA024788 [Acorus gramineus]